MATSLFEEKEIDPWKESFQLYEKILKVKADKEKKDKAKKLMELDHWQVNSEIVYWNVPVECSSICHSASLSVCRIRQNSKRYRACRDIRVLAVLLKSIEQNLYREPQKSLMLQLFYKITATPCMGKDSTGILSDKYSTFSKGPLSGRGGGGVCKTSKTVFFFFFFL